MRGGRAPRPRGELLAGEPVRRVRLQMLETEPLTDRVTTSLADGDSLRYYPAFAGPSRDALDAQDPVAARWAAQLLLVQRLDGGLTIGDTHTADEPFAFGLDETPYRHLLGAAAALLGREPPVGARALGRGLQPADRVGGSRPVPPPDGRAGGRAGDGGRRARDDPVAGHRPGDLRVSAPPGVELVCCDMAGTTVVDDGLVMAAFSAALAVLAPDPADPGRDQMTRYVVDTMGTSKIEVFRKLAADEATARRANAAFEGAYAARVAAGEARAVPGAATCCSPCCAAVGSASP